MKLVRFLFYFVFISGGLAVLAFLLILEDAPIVAALAAPTPEDVAATRTFVQDVRKAADARVAEARVIEVTEAQANSVLRLSSRFWPGIRATAEVMPGGVLGVVSVPIPWVRGQKWINAEGFAPPFEGRARLEAVRVGGHSLPPDLLVEAGRIGANLVLGERAGDVLLSSAAQLDLDGTQMAITLDLTEDEKGQFISRLFGTLRDRDMPPGEEIDVYFTAVRRAMDEGRLPDDGSFLNHLRFVLEMAADRATDSTLPNAYTAAVFGLAKACGARDFTLIVGRLASDSLRDPNDWETECENVLFSGRQDTRRHFVTAAAIQAASNRGVAISIGEFKELHDSLNPNNGGFDFTDIAANNSGIRLSNLVMAGTVEDLRATIALMQGEPDVLPDLRAIPSILTRPEFEAQFGTIDSPTYQAMLGSIEDKISALSIHRP